MNQKIDMEHPTVMRLNEVLLQAGKPLRLSDLARAVLVSQGSNGAANLMPYVVWMIRDRRVRQVGRGLYCHVRWLSSIAAKKEGGAI